MTELLLALPVVMMLGLGIAQFTLVYQAKHALDFALTQAARQGAVDHAAPASILRGLAAGLVPYLYGATDWAGLLAAEARATEHVAQGTAAGWIRLRQRSPSLESFDDWAEPALDEGGEVIPGAEEIPNDNLDSRRTRTRPRSGVAALHLGEAIGRVSGQTLADANLLRLEFAYGVRLAVPVVGSLIIRALSAWHDCRSATLHAPAATGNRLGLITLDPVTPIDHSQSWMCDFYLARDGEGKPAGRIPLRLAATLRMMSTARRSDMVLARETIAEGLVSLGPGRSDPPEDRSSPGDGNDGGGTEAGSEGRDGDDDERGGSHGPGGVVDYTPGGSQHRLGNGFLRIGGDRLYPLMQSHPALCPV